MKISILATTHEGYTATKEDFDTLSGHAAGICYMPDDYWTLCQEPQDKTIKRTGDAKGRVHHSVFGHPQVSLLLENVPKGLAMLLNNEGIYNTSERSARYRKMPLAPEEEVLYNKWIEIFNHIITEDYKKRCPNYFNARNVRTLAQQNARFLTSTFTPTTLEYTVSYQQLNYIYKMFLNEINNPNSNEFMTGLKPAMAEFCTALETATPYIDQEIAHGVDIKNRKLSLFDDHSKIEEYFGDVYATKYKGSFAQLAEAHRHRTLKYYVALLDEPEFTIPPCLKKSHALTTEWIRDCQSVAKNFPQGMLLDITEMGTLDWFIQKMKERKCTHAQLEINQQTNDTLKKYVDALTEKNHHRAEELKQYTRGSRCTFPGFTCPDPCGYPDGINETREI